MSEIIRQTMDKASFISSPAYEDYVETDKEARRIAAEMI
jgi:1-deoxy-D-xylulose-5-phosphate reductoisomerase